MRILLAKKSGKIRESIEFIDDFADRLYPLGKIVRITADGADVLENEFAGRAVAAAGVHHAADLLPDRLGIKGLSGHKGRIGLAAEYIIAAHLIRGNVGIRPRGDGNPAQVGETAQAVDLVVQRFAAAVVRKAAAVKQALGR